jgi:hypothetical protein
MSYVQTNKSTCQHVTNEWQKRYILKSFNCPRLDLYTWDLSSKGLWHMVKILLVWAADISHFSIYFQVFVANDVLQTYLDTWWQKKIKRPNHHEGCLVFQPKWCMEQVWCWCQSHKRLPMLFVDLAENTWWKQVHICW